MSFFREFFDPLTPQPGSGPTPGTTPGPTPPGAVSNPGGNAGTTTLPCGLFAGFIEEISEIRNAVPLTLAKAPVTAPYWTLASSAEHQLAFPNRTNKPAAVPTADGSDLEMRVKITVTRAENLSGTSTLRGRIGGGPYWEGHFPSAVGTHEVTVRRSAATTRLEAHRGDIMWEALVPGCGTHLVGITRVEIYCIVRAITPGFLTPGRPVEALRFIYDTIRVGVIDVGAGNPDGIRAATERITDYLHSSHGMSYDTVSGEMHFIDWGERAFELTDYMSRAKSTVNCYDQASAILVFATILGIDGFKRFVEPFGYITTTTLVGGIRTNNPFFTSAGNAPIVAHDDPTRTSFGNHEFFMTRHDDRVHDACAGPIVGWHTYHGYMASSIDMTRNPALPGNLPFFAPVAEWYRYWDAFRRDNWIPIEKLK